MTLSRSELHSTKLNTEQIGCGLEVVRAVTNRECPMVIDSAGTPGIDPLARIATEVDARGRVTDGEERSRHNGTFRGC